jgi:hypothetical protein
MSFNVSIHRGHGHHGHRSHHHVPVGSRSARVLSGCGPYHHHHVPRVYTPPIFPLVTPFYSHSYVTPSYGNRNISACTSIGYLAMITGLMLTIFLGSAMGGTGLLIGASVALCGGICLAFHPERP